MRLKNRTEEIREQHRQAGDELSSFKAAHRVTAEKRFADAGGCDRCRGRGWVVTWDTLDCVRGSYAQYATCPSETCTPTSREKSGLAPGNIKYDQWNRNSTWRPTYTPEAAKELDALDQHWRQLAGDLDKELARWVVSEGKLVKIMKAGRGPIDRRQKIGTVGLVQRKFTNNWGTEKLIVLDQAGNKHWPSVSLVEVIDPEPDTAVYDKIMKAERESNGVPIIVTIEKKTGKAALIKTTTGKETWVPFSQVPTLAKASLGSTVSALIPMWLVNQKKLIGGR